MDPISKRLDFGGVFCPAAVGEIAPNTSSTSISGGTPDTGRYTVFGTTLAHLWDGLFISSITASMTVIFPSNMEAIR
jgi:hypothetical protein